MQLLDKLLVVVDVFTLKGLHMVYPDLSADVEILYLDENSKFDDEDGIAVSDDLREVIRRKGELDAILAKHEAGICWFYSQVERIQLEANALRK